MRKLLIISILFLGAECLYSQQTASFSQYLFNGLAINPGYAGSHGMLSFSGLSRFQNPGLDGAPITNTIALHTPLPNQSFGVGLMAIKDQIGIISQTGVHGVGAYRIFLDNSGERFLSMGLQFGTIMYDADYNKIDVRDPEIAFEGHIRQSKPNFGAGIYYQTSSYYLGVSMPHLASNVFDRGPDFQTVYQNIPVVVTGGYLFFLNTTLRFKPNFLLKYVDGRFASLDINGSLLIDELLWVGVSYQLPSGVNLLTQFHVSEQLLFGYAYTLAQNDFRTANLGSHEILINYRFNFFKSGLINPRYF